MAQAVKEPGGLAADTHRHVDGEGGPLTAPATAPHFLVHNEGDLVGVAVQDVHPGPSRVVYLDSGREVSLDVTEEVPLGHKVALQPVAAGAPVIEYRVCVGLARSAIEPGQLVHTHNLRSARWEKSQ